MPESYIPVYLAHDCNFQPLPSGVYDFIEVESEHTLIVLGDTQTGKGALFLFDREPTG
jgi:hypothetical protein